MTKPENKKLTEQQELFLDLMFTPEFDGNIAAAHSAAGYSENTHYLKTMRTLSTDILERTEKYLAAHAPQSAMKIVDVLQNPNSKSARQVMDAAKEILDRAGVVKKQQMEVQVDAPSALLIIPEKNKE